MRKPSDLPRLLYVGDVPVEASYHGSALLYRLLQTYPKDRLRIIESGMELSLPERRLSQVTYFPALQPFRRWFNTRLNRWLYILLSLRATVFTRGVSKAVGDFQPEAVLTVAHGFSWLTAATYARRRRLPLHFIVHDDWPRIVGHWPLISGWVDRQFALCYREAVSRLCVSPFMVEDYERRYSTRGTVLYPGRAADCPVFDGFPPRLSQHRKQLVGAYAGSINSGSYVESVKSLAHALARVGGKLLLFGPHTLETLAVGQLKLPNVFAGGLLPSNELINRLRSEADFLFVPMSSEGARSDASLRTCFPSKLTDYTAAGLPILICGPEYCSAVRWARQNEPVAEVITSVNAAELQSALERLMKPEHRAILATRALQVGSMQFSHAIAERVFHAALLRS